MHDMMDFWRNQGYSALHYQQERFEKYAHEHQQAAYEEVQTAAALATSRTAAQNTSEANFSHPQRGLLSEITSESAQAHEADTHCFMNLKEI